MQLTIITTKAKVKMIIISSNNSRKYYFKFTSFYILFYKAAPQVYTLRGCLF